MDMRNIGSLADHIESGAIVIADLLVGYLSMEVHIMRQDKDLLDVPSSEYRILVFNRISNICTYSYHFPDQRTYDEEGAAVHT